MYYVLTSMDSLSVIHMSKSVIIARIFFISSNTLYHFASIPSMFRPYLKRLSHSLCSVVKWDHPYKYNFYHPLSSPCMDSPSSSIDGSANYSPSVWTPACKTHPGPLKADCLALIVASIDLLSKVWSNLLQSFRIIKSKFNYVHNIKL